MRRFYFDFFSLLSRFLSLFFFTSPVVVALLRVFILNITLLIPLRDLPSNKQTF